MAPSSKQSKKSKRLVTVLNDQTFLNSVIPMKLCHVKKIERHFSSSLIHLDHYLKDFSFNGFTARGTTPLILACQHGELDSVKYLIETWGVYEFSSAAYYSDPSKRQSRIKIESASPLFVACFHRHGNIVRYLLEQGADVSDHTFDFSNRNSKFHICTPLYGAFSDQQPFDSLKSVHQQKEERNIVVRILLEFGADPNADSRKGRPLWMEKMCGVDAITALIHHGLDLKQNDPITGRTILHYMAAHKRHFSNDDALAIVKLTVDKGADLMTRDKQGFTPLLAAASADYINFTVLDYLLDRDEYGRMEKIEAMELTGATILSKTSCLRNCHFLKGFQYWRRAYQLREMEIEESGSSAEKILGRKIGRNAEWTTLADLERIEHHPEEFATQSLMVKLRIFPESSRYLSSQYLGDLLSGSISLDDEEKFSQILGIRWGMLDQLLRHSDSNVLLSKFTIAEDVEEIVFTLNDLQEEHLKLFNFETIKTSLDLILSAKNWFVEIDKHIRLELLMNDFGTELFTQSLLSLLEMIVRLPEIPNEQNMDLLAQSLRQLGPFLLGNFLLSLLLNEFLSLSHSETLVLVRVLLDAGADPNVFIDEDFGNASLHVAAALRDRELSDATGRLLVGFGAKLHQVNKSGKTALDIWIKFNQSKGNWNKETGGRNARPEWWRPLPSLLHLAARVIRIHKIPYAGGATPVILHSLIDLR